MLCYFLHIEVLKIGGMLFVELSQLSQPSRILTLPIFGKPRFFNINIAKL